MTISRANAEAAITALVNGGTACLLNHEEFNDHLTEKHFSKQAAAEAARNSIPQGYFKRITPLTFTVFGDLYQSTMTQGKRNKVLAAANTATVRDFMNRPEKTPITVDMKFAAEKQDFCEIAWGVITSNARELHESTDHPERNFLAISPIPAGFYGRSIDRHGTKGRNLPQAVVVINAGVTSHPSLVTMYPVDNAYVASRPILA